MKISSFYEYLHLIDKIRSARRLIDNGVFNEVETLRDAYLSIDINCKGKAKIQLIMPDNLKLLFDVTSLKENLNRDLIFFDQSRDFLIRHLYSANQNVNQALFAARKIFDFKIPHHWISDKDDTLETLSETYRFYSQPFYIYQIILDFCRKISGSSALLTAAPYAGMGLESSFINNKVTHIIAASEGRELIGINEISIDERLVRCYNQINLLIQDTPLLVFSECMQLSVACIRIPIVHFQYFNKYKDKLINTISKCILGTPLHFFISASGIWIINKEEPKWSKVNGIAYLNAHTNEQFNKGSLLLCGNAIPDVLVSDYMHHRNSQCTSLFVTRDEAIKQSLRNVTKRCAFLPHPDYLLLLLAEM